MSEQTDALTHQERARRLGLMLAARPERLRMDLWTTPMETNECGTAACVAGWSVLWEQDAVRIDAEGNMTWPAPIWTGLGPEVRMTVQPRRSFELDGQQFLGLKSADAGALFYGAGNRTAVDTLQAIGRGELTDHGNVYRYVYHKPVPPGLDD